MNALELTKSQKKIARRIIDTGLQREYEAGIKKLDRIIYRWKGEELNDFPEEIRKTIYIWAGLDNDL